MGFAKIVPVGNVHVFDWFGIGEFFRFQGDIWVKYNSHSAVNISRGLDDDGSQEFCADTECENIDIELKIL